MRPFFQRGELVGDAALALMGFEPPTNSFERMGSKLPFGLVVLFGGAGRVEFTPRPPLPWAQNPGLRLLESVLWLCILRPIDLGRFYLLR